MIFCPGTVIIIFLLKQIFVTLVHSVGLDSDHRNVSVRNRFLQHSDNNIMNTYFNVENHQKLRGKYQDKLRKIFHYIKEYYFSSLSQTHKMYNSVSRNLRIYSTLYFSFFFAHTSTQSYVPKLWNLFNVCLTFKMVSIAMHCKAIA